MSTFNIETATLQEAVDYAVKKIVEQGGACETPNGACMYGDGKGRHCAVGWLLDHENEELMRFDGSVFGLVIQNGVSIPALVRDNQQVMHTLQRFHDMDSYLDRLNNLEVLKAQGIDTSGEHFQQWLNMATGADQ